MSVRKIMFMDTARTATEAALIAAHKAVSYVENFVNFEAARLHQYSGGSSVCFAC